MKDIKFRIDHAYSFLYPRHNYQGVRNDTEQRRLLVTKIRDTAKRALDPITTALNPMLRRGRLLVIGIDLDKWEERSFYVDSMQAIEEIPKQQPPTFGVVDRSSILEQSNNLTTCEMFALGRGDTAVPVRLLTPTFTIRDHINRKRRKPRIGRAG